MEGLGYSPGPAYEATAIFAPAAYSMTVPPAIRLGIHKVAKVMSVRAKIELQAGTLELILADGNKKTTGELTQDEEVKYLPKITASIDSMEKYASENQYIKPALVAGTSRLIESGLSYMAGCVCGTVFSMLSGKLQ
jgi:hypothetical protein